mmetsp:Transcript_35495/g.47931  ORF Transcript_35495/g.47931 Transcript_35495/m.47931 type:complete len:83 (-) Transcript_35495:736-984(-)
MSLTRCSYAWSVLLSKTKYEVSTLSCMKERCASFQISMRSSPFHKIRSPEMEWSDSVRVHSSDLDFETGAMLRRLLGRKIPA